MIYPQVLNESQLKLLPEIGPFASREGYYLGGGTGVALQLGHRLSVDFDFFSPVVLEDPMSLAGRAESQGIRLEQVGVSRGTLHAVAAGVNLSFLDYSYPLIGELVRWDDYSLDIASLDDLACMKLTAIAQRGAKRDFVDIYALATKHIPLSRMLELYKAKYNTSEIGNVLKGLTYFEDAEVGPMPERLWDVSWEEVKRRMTSWAAQIAR